MNQPPPPPPSTYIQTRDEIESPTFIIVGAALLVLVLACMGAMCYHRRRARAEWHRKPLVRELTRDSTFGGLLTHAVSRSDVLRPESAMNPAYEYALPSHLALVMRPLTTTLEAPTEKCKPTTAGSKPHPHGKHLGIADNWRRASGSTGLDRHVLLAPRRLPSNLTAMLPLPPAPSLSQTDTLSVGDSRGMFPDVAMARAGSQTAPLQVWLCLIT